MAFTGNYSSTFTLWDWVFGTDVAYKNWKGTSKLVTDANKEEQADFDKVAKNDKKNKRKASWSSSKISSPLGVPRQTS